MSIWNIGRYGITILRRHTYILNHLNMNIYLLLINWKFIWKQWRSYYDIHKTKTAWNPECNWTVLYIFIYGSRNGYIDVCFPSSFLFNLRLLWTDYYAKLHCNQISYFCSRIFGLTYFFLRKLLKYSYKILLIHLDHRLVVSGGFLLLAASFFGIVHKLIDIISFGFIEINYIFLNY